MKKKITLNVTDLTDEQVKALQDVGLIEKESGWYEPKNGEKYYFLDEEVVQSLQWEGCDWDRRIAKRQQLFRTKEEAEEAGKRRIAETTIKRWIAKRSDWKPDWTDRQQKKWRVNYDHETSMFDCRYTTYTQHAADFFPSQELAEQCVKECRDSWKIIYGV